MAKEPPEPEPFHRPFASPFEALKQTLGPLPAGPAAAPALEPTAKGPPRAVVRLERKGRRGKDVTVVEQLDLRASELEKWLTDFKRKLGCGGVIEGRAMILQGDSRERVRALLEARGVRKISVG
jgi:translation initiation factor 1